MLYACKAHKRKSALRAEAKRRRGEVGGKRFLRWMADWRMGRVNYAFRDTRIVG